MTAATRHADDNLLNTFLTAMNTYRDQHRHAEPVATLIRNAQRAGIEAVINATGWIPTPPGPGVFCTWLEYVAAQGVRSGQWRTVGDNGSIYVIEPAYVPAYPPPSTDDASSVNGAP